MDELLSVQTRSETDAIVESAADEEVVYIKAFNKVEALLVEKQRFTCSVS